MKREGKSRESAGEGTRSLARAFVQPGKKFDYLSGRCRRQSGGSRMLLPWGEWKDIVIPRHRHSSPSLSNRPAILHAAAGVGIAAAAAAAFAAAVVAIIVVARTRVPK